MALLPYFCGGCGLEIDHDDAPVTYKGVLYHPWPYKCNPEPEDPFDADQGCP
jgi:hypothetical protein